MIDVVAIDDETVLARNIARFLGRRGYSVAVAGTVAAGRALCRVKRPLVVLTDYDLPDGNGLALIDELRVEDSPCGLALITGRGGDDLERIALREGADRYLQKPIALETLASTVEELSQKARRERLVTAAFRWGASVDRVFAADPSAPEDIADAQEKLEDAVGELYDAVELWRDTEEPMDTAEPH